MSRRTRTSREFTAAVTAAATTAVPAAAKGLIGDGIEHHLSLLTRARLHRHSPGMIYSSVGSPDYRISWGGGGLGFVLFLCCPVSHGNI